MKLKILNKKNFLKNFLDPISRVNDLCTLTLQDGKIFNLNKTPDSSYSLYAQSVDVEYELDEDVLKRLISFADLKKFIKLFDCIQQDENIELELHENNIEYKTSNVKFKFHLIDDKIVRSPNFNIDKINSINYTITFDIAKTVHQALIKSSTFITDSNKIYISTEDNNVIGEMTDKTRINIDTLATILSDKYEGKPLSEPLPFNFDLIRSLCFLKSDSIKTSINVDRSVIAFDVHDNNYKLKYIATANVN